MTEETGGTAQASEIMQRAVASAWDRSILPQTMFASQLRELATAVEEGNSLRGLRPSSLADDIEGLLDNDRISLSDGKIVEDLRNLANGYEEAPEMEMAAVANTAAEEGGA